MIALMQPQANRAHVVLRSSLSREVPAIVADQRTLRQIVLNLLSNSVKFTGPGGQVIASTSLAETGEALLRIRDTGEGMSEEELARALEPFRQIATATLADRTGTGPRPAAHQGAGRGQPRQPRDQQRPRRGHGRDDHLPADARPVGVGRLLWKRSMPCAFG